MGTPKPKKLGDALDHDRRSTIASQHFYLRLSALCSLANALTPLITQ
jgi:hypothetical protein